MNTSNDSIAISLLSEIITLDQLARARLSKALPKGMELSHFSVLNHLAHVQDERSPAELARVFYVTRGAMTNTFNKLEMAGQSHIRSDGDDARRKCVSISGAGKLARDAALASAAPVLTDLVSTTGPADLKSSLAVLRNMRRSLSEHDT